MILSASAPSALAETGDSYTYVTKQIIFAVIGLVGMWFVSKIDYRVYKKFYWLIYWGSIGVLLLVLIPGLGSEGGGARRWINLGFAQFQPSEFTKIGMIVFYAGYLTDHKNELRSFVKGFLKPLSIFNSTCSYSLVYPKPFKCWYCNECYYIYYDVNGWM